MCLSLVGLTAASAAEMKAPATGGVLSQPVLSSVKKIKDARIAALETEISANAFIKEGVDCKRNSDRERLETFRPQIHALKCSASLQNTHSSTREVATKNHPHANDNVTSVHTLLETTDNLGIHDNIAFDDSSAFHNRLPSFLTNRGGQRQLYSSEDAPAVLPLNSRPIQMPQQLTLGFFVAARPLSGGALCC
jgi:hypothetical protein